MFTIDRDGVGRFEALGNARKRRLRALLFDRFDLVLTIQSDKTTWLVIAFAVAWMFIQTSKIVSAEWWAYF